MKIYQIILLYVVLPLMGIGLIVFAVTWGKRLVQRPVEITVSKLGLNLKTDTLVILILLGSVMASMGVYFIFQGYEKRIEETNKENNKQLIEKDTEIKILSKSFDNLSKSFDKFKVYAMRFRLIFKSTNNIDTQKFKVQIYNWKQGKGEPQITSPATIPGVNELWVSVGNLNAGDELRIIVYEDENKKWQSGKIEIPKTDLLMTKVE